MEEAIIDERIGMTQTFDADGKVIPVIVIEVGPCTVVQKKTEEEGGYNAVQLDYGDMTGRKLTKPELGHLRKVGDTHKKTLKKFKPTKATEMNVSDEVKVDVFTEGNCVGVTNISEDRGYQGIIRRHDAHRLREARGSGPVVRHTDSMGADNDPSRTFKDKVGAGQTDNGQVAVSNLDVVKVDAELGILAVRGTISDPKSDIAYLCNSVISVKGKGVTTGISSNPQRTSAYANPQKTSVRNK